MAVAGRIARRPSTSRLPQRAMGVRLCPTTTNTRMPEDAKRTEHDCDATPRHSHHVRTLGGRRLLEMEDLSAASALERAASAPGEFLQTPGSFYIGNMCAIRHNVKHYGPEAQAGLFKSTARDEKSPDGHVIAVVIRSNFFREARGLKKDATPGPAELFHAATRRI